jgi:hypothetical protein
MISSPNNMGKGWLSTRQHHIQFRIEGEKELIRLNVGHFSVADVPNKV